MPCPSEDAERGQADGQIADRVVARADPYRAHVGVAAAMPKQQQRNAEVGHQRHDRDDAHRDGLRRRAGLQSPGRAGQDEDTERGHAGRLHDGRLRANVHRHRQHCQRQTVVGRVAEEVDRIGEQRDRPEDQLAATSARNMSRLTANAIHSARRKRGSTEGGWGEQQEADMERSAAAARGVPAVTRCRIARSMPGSTAARELAELKSLRIVH